MRRKPLIAIGACSLALSFVSATLAAPQKPANVAGVWILALGGMANRSLTITLAQDGSQLKGTMGPANAKGGAPLTGTVNGNKVAFAFLPPPHDGKSIAEKFSGTVTGDAMTGTVEVVMKGFTGLESFMNGDRFVPWTAKRQK